MQEPEPSGETCACGQGSDGALQWEAAACEEVCAWRALRDWDGWLGGHSGTGGRASLWTLDFLLGMQGAQDSMWASMTSRPEFLGRPLHL